MNIRLTTPADKLGFALRYSGNQMAQALEKKGIHINPEDEPVDIEHVVYPTSFRHALVLLRLLTINRKTPVLLHFRGGDLRPTSALRLIYLKLWLNRGCFAIYSTVDLEYPLDYLKPELPREWVPQGIDVEKFKPLGVKRKDRFLITGTMDRIKHWEDWLDRMDDSKIDAIEWGPDLDYYKKRYPGITWIPRRPNPEMVKLYSQYRTVIPQYSVAFKFGAYGRCELEAAACGCEVYGTKLTRKEVCEEYSIEAAAEKCLGVYHRILGKKVGKKA